MTDRSRQATTCCLAQELSALASAPWYMIGRWPALAARWPTLRAGRWLNEHIAVDSNVVRVFSHLELAGARGLSAGEIGD